jgi:hypothetical protein
VEDQITLDEGTNVTTNKSFAYNRTWYKHLFKMLPTCPFLYSVILYTQHNIFSHLL